MIYQLSILAWRGADSWNLSSWIKVTRYTTWLVRLLSMPFQRKQQGHQNLGVNITLRIKRVKILSCTYTWSCDLVTWTRIVKKEKSGVGILKPRSLFLNQAIFWFYKSIRLFCWNSYLSGVSIVKLRRQQSNINMVFSNYLNGLKNQAKERNKENWFSNTHPRTVDQNNVKNRAWTKCLAICKQNYHFISSNKRK